MAKLPIDYETEIREAVLELWIEGANSVGAKEIAAKTGHSEGTVRKYAGWTDGNLIPGLTWEFVYRYDKRGSQRQRDEVRPSYAAIRECIRELRGDVARATMREGNRRMADALRGRGLI
jgi:hypothetical protein